MDIPSEVINAVKETKQDLATPTPKARKPYVKKLTKRILHALGNGLRTSTSIANALGVPKDKIQSNLWHMKNKGLVHSSKQEGKAELKYHLTTDKPVLDKLDLTKTKRKYTKRVVKTPVVDKETLKKLEETLARLGQVQQRISQLEHVLSEKDKEVWTLECEVFDKKAIIKYLEEKLFQLGVRV